MGGIATVTDALEFIIAGANAVQVGTANFVYPMLWQGLIDGINEYLDRHGLARVSDLVGKMER
jgi:dihydroorotate dehydrogenase (NAD+) catalytic subunit